MTEEIAKTLNSAINIMATFVHNEPTSLSIIQEAGLPELFYRIIEVGIEPSIEVLLTEHIKTAGVLI